MTMRKIQLTANRSKSNSAWTKAPADVAVIAERMGFEAYDIDRGLIERASLAGRVLNKFGLLIWANRCVFRRHLGELRKMFKSAGGGQLLIQHPVPNMVSAEISRINELAGLKEMGVRIVVIVHDLGSLRGNCADVGGSHDDQTEVAIFSSADSLIVHNESMRLALLRCGCAGDKMLVLGMFDYLTDCTVAHSRCLHSPRRVAVAGGLGAGKARYTECLKKIRGVEWILYGHGYDVRRHSGVNIKCGGCLPPEILPQMIDADFGLVWDGDSIDTCEGATGNYLRYNNPHKFSLYVASELPLIVWSESALAKTVKELGIGITVDRLGNLNDILNDVTDIEYQAMVTSLKGLSSKVRSGYFTAKALS